jgi:hypothetical protein
MAGGALLMAGLGLQTAHARCRDRVESRDDSRSVWLYLVARDPDRVDDPDVVEFVAFLNDRLPPLECNFWGSPGEVET